MSSTFFKYLDIFLQIFFANVAENVGVFLHRAKGRDQGVDGTLRLALSKKTPTFSATFATIFSRKISRY